MEENNKENNECLEFSDNISKSNKSCLSQIILSTKRYPNLPKNSIIEEKAKSQKYQNIRINGLPNIKQQNLFSSTINQFNKVPKYSRNNFNFSNENLLQKLLVNSLDFEHYQRAVIESNLFFSQKNSLPKIQNEEKKDSNKKMESFYYEKSSCGTTKNFLHNSVLLSKNYSLCLNTLKQIKTNKRYNFIKLQELMKNTDLIWMR